jgi:hypothetical protein
LDKFHFDYEETDKKAVYTLHTVTRFQSALSAEDQTVVVHLGVLADSSPEEHFFYKKANLAQKIPARGLACPPCASSL